MPIYKTTPDSDLLNLLKRNDRLAFNELYERHWLSLYNIAFKRLNDQETCKDIVQDVFTDLWHKRHIKEVSNLTPYLHTAVRYKVYSLLSKGRATAHFIELFENMLTSALTADGYLADKELMRVFTLWLETLPEKRREIFKLRYTEELSTRAIGLRLNLSQKTVQNQLAIAFHNLRSFIGCWLLIVGFLLDYSG